MADHSSRRFSCSDSRRTCAGVANLAIDPVRHDLAAVVNEEELKGSIDDLRRDIERRLEPGVMDDALEVLYRALVPD